MVALIDRRSQIRRVLLVTLLFNLLVVGLKAGLGWWTGSLSLLADALHSITDSASNVLGLLTNQLSSPTPDREHPYGHQKFEALGALGISAFLAIACFEILQGAIARLWFEAPIVRVSPPILWLMLLVMGINIFVATYERRIGQKLGSPILIADAQHTASDIWITLTVIGGLIGVQSGYPWLDIVLAFPVALLVLRSAWKVLHQNLPWLVDEMAIAPEAIQAIVLQVPGVINCHNISSRGLVGRKVFIEMHLIVTPEDVETAHQITEAVEASLEDKYAPTRILIHVEPREYQSKNITPE
ncbi:cation transporter [Oscillatoriales cyanobacterium LEGE 11467]|uniref:Cation transporter n=1 Tax=Zarconia navalis LEGE 11467 TaxID=1828826 RepID=A0A928Z7F7_9CYAN|nr:cation diffusion facilitator family transporter [Zarconia navalis]MBE9039638.1 cation transporter [Zarconia navalis LEGE 11467]